MAETNVMTAENWKTMFIALAASLPIYTAQIR